MSKFTDLAEEVLNNLNVRQGELLPESAESFRQELSHQLAKKLEKDLLEIVDNTSTLNLHTEVIGGSKSLSKVVDHEELRTKIKEYLEVGDE